MAKINNNRLPENESNLPANQNDMNQMYYRPNEASFNYNGVTLNINIPVFVDNLKKFTNMIQDKKARKELKKLEQKTMNDVQHHSSTFEDIEED